MTNEKIILFGGTFDPIHRGHLQVARAAMEWIGAEQVILIPARRSPHKMQQPIAPDQARREMILRAITEQKYFRFSDCEFNRPQPSYTLDTVLDFREKWSMDTSLYWLVGADTIRDLPLWYQIDRLMDACIVAVMYRAGYPKPNFKECRKHFSPEHIRKLEENIVPVPLIDISSTEIRERLAKGQDVSQMLAPEVYEYIKQEGLYR